MNADDSARRGRGARTVCFIALLAALFGAAGCATDPTIGYSAASTHPTQVRTIAIHIFENETFDRSVEFDLADALVKEIESRTPYKVTTARRADTILSGRITRVERDQLSKARPTGLSQEVILGVTVDFVWQEARTDRVLTERKEFTGQALFVPSPPHAEPQEIGRFAVVQQLARDIVDEMRGQW